MDEAIEDVEDMHDEVAEGSVVQEDQDTTEHEVHRSTSTSVTAGEVDDEKGKPEKRPTDTDNQDENNLENLSKKSTSATKKKLKKKDVKQKELETNVGTSKNKDEKKKKAAGKKTKAQQNEKTTEEVTEDLAYLVADKGKDGKLKRKRKIEDEPDQHLGVGEEKASEDLKPATIIDDQVQGEKSENKKKLKGVEISSETDEILDRSGEEGIESLKPPSTTDVEVKDAEGKRKEAKEKAINEDEKKKLKLTSKVDFREIEMESSEGTEKREQDKLLKDLLPPTLSKQLSKVLSSKSSSTVATEVKLVKGTSKKDLRLTSSSATVAREKKRVRRREKDSTIDIVEDPETEYHEGLITLTISPQTQKEIGCVIGEQVTTENPWIEVGKELILQNLDVYDTMSDFISVKKEINALTLEDLMIGYESANDNPNQFSVCVTVPANSYIRNFLDSTKAERQTRVQEAQVRSCRKWVSLGSEKEIEDFQPKYTRPLYEVEAQTTVELLAVETDFSDRNVGDVPKGYISLLPREREKFNMIEKKRVETGVQACPESNVSIAQTSPPLPKNMWTHYEYMATVPEAIDEELIAKLKISLEEKNDFLDTVLGYNEKFNLYKDDYSELVVDAMDTHSVPEIICEDYQSFYDVRYCKHKFISAISWHPTLTGTVACAYADTIRTISIPIKKDVTDEVFRAVYGSNVVIIWSFVDFLTPKLILKTSREVHALQFCPFNENILVGGCINGQVVIWDLTDRIKKVEEVIVLTPNKQKYRKALFSLIGWMKNVRDLTCVHPAAMSALELSPNCCITSIQWLTPYHRISPSGRYQDTDDTSLQFLTSSENGTVCVWDLQASINKYILYVRPRKKKGKKKRPEAPGVSISKYRPLHRALSPIFRINIMPHEHGNNIPVSALLSERIKIKLVERTVLNSNRKLSLSERLMYKPVFSKPEQFPKQQFYGGTIFGDVFKAEWKGYEFDTGEIVNSENSTFPMWGEFHDAPIVSISRSVFNDYLILTVSANLFAIWKEDFENAPLLWRKSRVKLTRGMWSEYMPSEIILSRGDGSFEIWDFLIRSDKPVSIQNISGEILTGVYPNKFGPVQNVLGFADHNGSLRVFTVPRREINANDANDIAEFFDREIQLRKAFQSWQKDWLNRHESRLQAKKDALEAKIKEKKEMEQLEEERRERKEEEMRRLLKKPEWTGNAHKRWNAEQGKDYMRVIRENARKIDKEDLFAKRRPLLKIKEDEEKMRLKHEGMVREQNKIFEDTVGILFPETVTGAAKRSTGNEALEELVMTESLQSYKEIEQHCLSYINNNPFKCDFEWKDLVAEGMEAQETRKSIQQPSSLREERHQKAKNERRLLQILGDEEERAQISASDAALKRQPRLRFALGSDLMQSSTLVSTKLPSMLSKTATRTNISPSKRKI
ncbi:dynein axonemal intermediate chain 3-like [Periplaneta americana]|uniref:dynein axonemal intermediate chain 3-like n=1 Tax=Periplaneta americana TaxID=6978 RepID=UPI0037E6FEB6